ncbi:MAG TPA: fumarylacetoacetate hydrolase family protein [Ktedonobacterales bacterium]|nr:fumarylacetoacetate hydrolase family protein [Ktedonobacterales bacterium]
MRLATFRTPDGARIGVVNGDSLLDIGRAALLAGEEPPPELRDMQALIEAGSPGLERVAALVAGAEPQAYAPLAGVELLAPLPRPRRNVFCLGRNYAEHARESLQAIGEAVKLPEYPNVFTKATTAITGPYADIPYDAALTQELDWEVELAAVIGRAGRHIHAGAALSYVVGYTILNDVTARDIQHKPGIQWFQGKSLDASSPMGPWLVTADELANPQSLELTLRVNGTVKQRDSTANMLFDVATIIATLSKVLTLEPGDIIATGTPAGVGFSRTPPEFLRPGDVMESEIEGVGVMRNRVVGVG